MAENPSPHLSSVKSTSSAPGDLAAHSASATQILRDYLDLTKPEITFLVILSSVAGFVLAPATTFDVATFIYLILGVGLTSAGAGTLNHWLERERDAVMRRTMNRPLPSGRISPVDARTFGGVLVAAGVGLLCPLTNPLTGILASITVLLYLFVYTPLKQRTTWNTLMGTVPGALPALGGWTAATGSIGWGGLAAFCILAAWQMPHFLSLAWMYRKDYGRANFAMLPVAEPDGRSTVRQTLLYTLLLFVASFAPVGLGLSSWMYGLGAALLGLWFLEAAYAFFRTRSVQDARRVLRVSVLYIPILVSVLILDRIVFHILLP